MEKLGKASKNLTKSDVKEIENVHMPLPSCAFTDCHLHQHPTKQNKPSLYQIISLPVNNISK